MAKLSKIRYICIIVILVVMLSENQIDAAVKQIFDGIGFQTEPAGLYDPLRYMISVGGKRIRPRLYLTSYALFRDSLSEDIYSVAEALEVFHTFTLIHDDIMDRSALRRGMPTVWAKWDTDTAILSGDVMLIDAYKRIAKAPAKVAGKVLDLFSRTAAQVCEGQQYDMEFESLPMVSMDRYKMMIGLKTAVLLACSAAMGAIMGGASEEECEALYNYGYELGMAFQVADDYLDAYGDEKVFGKPIGGDIINAKKSWLTVRVLEKTSDGDAFIKSFSAPVETDEQKGEKIACIKQIYNELGVDEDAKYEVLRYSRQAMDAVSGIGLNAVRTEALRRFAEKLVGRVR